MKKINFTKPDFTKLKTKVTEKFREIRNDKKKLAIWITSAVTVAALILCAVIFLPGASKGNASSDSATVSSNKVAAATQKSSTNTTISKKKSKATATPTASTEASASPTPSAKTETKKDTKTATKSDSKKTNKKSNTANSKNNKTANKTNGATASKNNNTSSGNTSSSTQTQQKPAEKKCHDVYHDAEGHWETVVTGQKWIQDTQDSYQDDIVCACGKHFGTDYDAYSSHADDALADGDLGHGYSVQQIVIPGTGHYEDITEQKYVIDKQAWTETVCE